MANIFAAAKQHLLDPVGLTEHQLQTILGGMLGNVVDTADLYFQSNHSESWVLENGVVKEGNYHIERGVGARVISGEKTGFAYSEDLVLPALTDAARAARSIAKQGQAGRIQTYSQVSTPVLYPQTTPLDSLTEQQKVDLLRRVDEHARQQDPRVKEVIVSLLGFHEVIMILNSDGTVAADIRPLVRMSISVIVEHQGRREQGSHGGGGRSDYHFFLEQDRALGYAREAVRQALVNLDAVEAPAGTMPVILGPGWPAVLLHEAVGHGLEGDFNRKGTSTFSGRVGERVATPCCTVVDDGTLVGRRGSLNVDDEGIPTQCTTLIENGILKAYMQDRNNARLMGTASTGNGRRESFAHVPMPRMTNTYMLAGVYEPEEIIKTVPKGLYAVNFGGGSVDITSGRFVFSASEAYLIEDGKVTVPVKGATLIGNGPDVMQEISMVGNDLQLDSGVGVCGKDGQSVPVGVGQPTLKVDKITVGGTSA